MKRGVVALALLALAGLAAADPPYLVDLNKGLDIIPPAATTGAMAVDRLGLAMLVVCVLILLVVTGLVTWFGLRYRRASKVVRKPPMSPGRANWVELGWIAALLVLFMVFFVWGAKVYLDLYTGPADALTIQVLGKQWMWKAQHPNGVREINSLHVPTRRPVRLQIQSADVVHSFSVPAFRLKRDAVPGMVTEVWFTATRPGVYRLFCAEYCGTQHARMRGKVVVMKPAQYQAWLEGNGAEAAPASRGKQLFQAYGCSGCHLGKTAVRAPSLDGIYGRAVPLADGSVVIADEGYLRDSVLRPRKHVVAGYAPIMPSFQGRIEAGDLQQIIAYIKSLQVGDWERFQP